MLKLIFGCGYLGQRVAAKWLAAGHEVWAVTRSAERAAELAPGGIRPVVWDIVVSPLPPLELPRADTVLFAVGHDRAAGRSIHEVHFGGLRHALAALSDATGRFIYVSSTGVFGQSEGEFVNETSPCQPTRDGGRACWAAEQLLAADRLGDRSLVLRLAGLYGPGRLPRRQDILAGTIIPVPASGWLNLIHVDDAATVVLAAEERATPPRLYVVSDGHPVLRRDYFRELARLLNAPEPRFEDPPADSPVAQRATSDKRIDNARMLAELEVRLRFPSYREGLAGEVS